MSNFEAQSHSLFSRCLRLATTITGSHPRLATGGWLDLTRQAFHLLDYSPLSGRTTSICCSLFVFKLYHKTCEHFYRSFGLYEKSPNSFLPGLSHSIINQFRFHNLICLCLASVHLTHPFHLIFSFQLLGHAVLLCQLWHDQFHAASCRFVNLGAMLKELVE